MLKSKRKYKQKNIEGICKLNKNVKKKNVKNIEKRKKKKLRIGYRD